jgi:hypothetical protein
VVLSNFWMEKKIGNCMSPILNFENFLNLSKGFRLYSKNEKSWGKYLFPKTGCSKREKTHEGMGRGMLQMLSENDEYTVALWLCKIQHNLLQF